MNPDDPGVIRGQAGAACHVVNLPIDLDVQFARIAHREARTPTRSFPMPEDAVLAWRDRFQVPTAGEFAGEDTPSAPPGWETWLEWAVDRWPTLDPSTG
ncbi:MAG: hypothetical protein M0Z51_12025 [Propionibacterium sp.]|nr:hypothetical protein [Propionibacterium sp.]